MEERETYHLLDYSSSLYGCDYSNTDGLFPSSPSIGDGDSCSRSNIDFDNSGYSSDIENSTNDLLYGMPIVTDPDPICSDFSIPENSNGMGADFLRFLDNNGGRDLDSSSSPTESIWDTSSHSSPDPSPIINLNDDTIDIIDETQETKDLYCRDENMKSIILRQAHKGRRVCYSCHRKVSRVVLLACYPPCNFFNDKGIRVHYERTKRYICGLCLPTIRDSSAIFQNPKRSVQPSSIEDLFAPKSSKRGVDKGVQTEAEDTKCEETVVVAPIVPWYRVVTVSGGKRYRRKM